MQVGRLGRGHNFGGILMRLYWKQVRALDSYQLIGMS
jgi:hypothetical protein